MVTTIAKPDGERQYEEFKNVFYKKYTEIAKAKLDQEISLINVETQAKQKVIESEAEAKKRQQHLSINTFLLVDQKMTKKSF